MKPAPAAWRHLTPAVEQRYVAFLLATLPDLARTALPWYRRIGPARRHAVLRAALDAARGLPGLGLEFGVYKGVSLRLSARAHPHRRFFGFDSFTGFPEDGRPDWQLDFTTIDLPVVPANCTLVPGWFADSVPHTLAQHPGPLAFVNVDCDIYSAARTALFALEDRLRPGAILYFDEILNYDTWLWNEMLALFEFLDATGFGIEWIALDRKVRPLEDTLAMLGNGRYPQWTADVAAGYGRAAALRLTAAPASSGWRPSAAPDEVARHALAFDTLTERLRQGVLVRDYCDPDDPAKLVRA